MLFEKAEIEIQREKEFGELHSAVERAFSPEQIERYLKQMQRERIRIRDLEAVLKRSVLDQTGQMKSSAVKSGQLYEALPASDQAQIREFYLSQVEKVEPRLRQKFHKLYQYY